jgi:hypothetical protein
MFSSQTVLRTIRPIIVYVLATMMDASTGNEIVVNNLWKNGNNNPHSGATDNISPDLLHHIMKLRTLLINVYKVKRTNLQCEAL